VTEGWGLLPVTSHQSPVTSHQSPVTSHQSPVTNHQSPALGSAGRLVCVGGRHPPASGIRSSMVRPRGACGDAGIPESGRVRFADHCRRCVRKAAPAPLSRRLLSGRAGSARPDLASEVAGLARLRGPRPCPTLLSRGFRNGRVPAVAPFVGSCAEFRQDPSRSLPLSPAKPGEGLRMTGAGVSVLGAAANGSLTGLGRKTAKALACASGSVSCWRFGLICRRGGGSGR
jgi:hypothetical protein